MSSFSLLCSSRDLCSFSLHPHNTLSFIIVLFFRLLLYASVLLSLLSKISSFPCSLCRYLYPASFSFLYFITRSTFPPTSSYSTILSEHSCSCLKEKKKKKSPGRARRTETQKRRDRGKWLSVSHLSCFFLPSSSSYRNYMSDAKG